MSSAPRLGWWQASDGEWYPPELHPNHRHHAPPPVPTGHLFEHATVVQPKHQRPGAGSYTVQPVTRPARGLSAALAALAVALGSVVVVGGAIFAVLTVAR